MPFRKHLLLFLALPVAGCQDTTGAATGGNEPLDGPTCTIPQNQIYDAANKDAIPSLTNPDFVTPDHPKTDYLDDSNRVIGVMDGDQPLAVPLNIMWYHEIVNLKLGDDRVALTHCPLTGSSIAFDREVIQGVELGVSGLLYRNNLIMYDRADRESLWPQMLRSARCGDRTGTPLPLVPMAEMTWAAWKDLHPNTLVVSRDTGYPRRYDINPYGLYDRPDDDVIFYPMEDIDPRRPPKERVLGFPNEEGGVALPFGYLDETGPVSVTHLTARRESIVVFWDREAQGALAFRRELEGEALSFRVEEERIKDEQTGTTWRLDGLAMDGPLAGSRLEPFSEGYVAYWFAWAAFHPRTDLRE